MSPRIPTPEQIPLPLPKPSGPPYEERESRHHQGRRAHPDWVALANAGTDLRLLALPGAVDAPWKPMVYAARRVA